MGRYFLVHTKKSKILAAETDDANIFRGLINDKLYSLKSGDKLTEVTADFVVTTLKNINEEDEKKHDRMYDWVFYITGLIVAFSALYPVTFVKVTLFQMLAIIMTAAYIIMYKRKAEKKLKKVYEKNYYTALLESDKNRGNR